MTIEKVKKLIKLIDELKQECSYQDIEFKIDKVFLTFKDKVMDIVSEDK